MEKRNDLIADHVLTHATGTGERDAAAAMVARLPGQYWITAVGEKAYDSANFFDYLRCLMARPHVTRNIKDRRSTIDRRTTHHAGYAESQGIRKRSEKPSAGASWLVPCAS